MRSARAAQIFGSSYNKGLAQSTLSPYYSLSWINQISYSLRRLLSLSMVTSQRLFLSDSLTALTFRIPSLAKTSNVTMIFGSRAFAGAMSVSSNYPSRLLFFSHSVSSSPSQTDTLTTSQLSSDVVNFLVPSALSYVFLGITTAKLPSAVRTPRLMGVTSLSSRMFLVSLAYNVAPRATASSALTP